VPILSEVESTVEPKDTGKALRARKRILLISYLFPPAGGIGVQRALSLARYLPDSGFDVHVLRAGNAAAPVMDPGLCRLVPETTQVHSAFSPEVPFWLRHSVWNFLSSRGKVNSPQSNQNASPQTAGSGIKRLVTKLIRRVLCPEPEVLWYPFAIRAASRIVKKHAIDVVMVTAPPFSTFLVGNALKRAFPHITYVADFRDEWISFYLQDFDFQKSEYTQRRAIEIERETIESADLVVAVAEASRQRIRSRYADQPDSKFLCISNGFDPEVFRNYTPRRNQEKKLIVSHVGTAYKTASPQYYLDALDGLPEQLCAGIETRFIGRITEPERKQLEGRKSAVRILGFMPQSEALITMEETDCLLLTMTNDISLPGKLYEYLAARKPVIALSPKGGEVDEFVRQTGVGWCVDYRDRSAIQSLLRQLYMQKVGSGLIEGGIAADETVRSFERPRLVAAYAQAIASLRSATGGPAV
jgi:glycosyltransferase involved in cell wall biosynthesis